MNSDDKSPQKRSFRKRWIVYGLLGLFIFYVLMGSLFIPIGAKYLAPAIVNNKIEGKLGIGWIWINPFTFKITLNDLRLANSETEKIGGIEKIVLNFDPIGTLLKNEVRAQEFSVKRGYFDIVIDGENSVNVVEALRLKKPQEKEKGEDKGAVEEIPQVWIGLLEIADIHIDITDRRHEDELHKRLDPINFKMENLRTLSEQANGYILSAITADAENLNVTGSMQLNPLTVEGDFILENLLLKDYSEYAEKAANYKIKDGVFTLGFHYKLSLLDSPMTLDLSKGRIGVKSLHVTSLLDPLSSVKVEGIDLNNLNVGVQIPTEGDPEIKLTADLLISQFKAQLNDAEEPFSRFESLDISPIEFSLKPDFLKIGDIKLNRVEALVERNANGEFVLMQFTESGTSEKEAKSEKESKAGEDKNEKGFVVEIGQFELSDGVVSVKDKSVKPEANFTVNPLNIRVSPITLDKETSTKVILNALFEKTGNIELESNFHLMDPTLQTKAALKLSDLSLTAFSPYAATMIGQPIKQGEFSGDFDYEISDNLLDASNLLRVKTIRFGNVVSGYNGKTYPVGTVIGLLENGDGEVVVNIPLSGSLDNPQFNPAKIVTDVLRGLILKAVTAPFNLVGKLTGGVISGLTTIGDEKPEEDYSSVSFVAGSDRLSQEENKALETVAEMLKTRPLMLIEINGSYDASSDPQAAIQLLWEEKLKKVDGKNEHEKILQLFGEYFPEEIQPTVAENAIQQPSKSPSEREVKEKPAVQAKPESLVETEKDSQSQAQGHYIYMRRGVKSGPVSKVLVGEENNNSFDRNMERQSSPEEEPMSADSDLPDTEEEPVAQTIEESKDDTDLEEKTEIAAALSDEEMKSRLLEVLSKERLEMSTLATNRAERIKNIFIDRFGLKGERVLISESTTNDYAGVRFELKSSLDAEE